MQNVWKTKFEYFHDRRWAVGRLADGQSVITVATTMRPWKRTILRLKKAAEGGNSMQKLAGGHKRIITPQKDWYVSKVAKRNRNAPSSQIPADLAIATGAHISDRTISCPLNQVGLNTQKPAWCILIQLHYWREGLCWCKEHIGWGHQQWSRVMFSESRFTVKSDSGLQLLWKEKGTHVKQHVHERNQYDRGMLV